MKRPDFASKALQAPDPRIADRIRRFGFLSGGIALSVACLVLLDRATGDKIVLTPFGTISPARILATAIAGGLSLSALLLYRMRLRAVRIIASVLALVITSAVLLEYLLRLPDLFSAAILGSPLDERVPPNSAFCLWCSSIGILLYSVSNRALLAQFVSLVSATVALIAIIGYIYSVEPLYGIGSFSAMSLPGALTYVFLATSLLLYHRSTGVIRILAMHSAAGVMSRRLYLGVLLIPPILGYFALVRSPASSPSEFPYTIALLVVASMILLAITVAVTSLRLERVDIERSRAEQGLRESRERLRELSSHMQMMQEEERIRIAREVHDELGQSLTALKMDVSLLRNRLPEEPEVERRTGSMLKLVNSTIKSVQRISTELRPSVLDDLGLAAAIEWQAREFGDRSGIRCVTHLTLPESIELPGPVATALFRVLQETLTNVARHAEASRVMVSLRQEENTVVLEVRDDGIGATEEQVNNSRSLGVMGMRERTTLFGGSLSIRGTEAEGTTVLVRIPLNSSRPEAHALTEPSSERYPV